MPKNEVKPIYPYLEKCVEVFKEQAFVLETIAHLRGYEVELLPIAESLRDDIKTLQDLARKAKLLEVGK